MPAPCPPSPPLTAGANPNITAPAYGGGTALHMAIQEGRGSPAMFAQLMATKSTDVNALDSGGSSPLHAALHQTVFDDPAAKAAQAVQMAVKIAASGRCVSTAPARQLALLTVP